MFCCCCCFCFNYPSKNKTKNKPKKKTEKKLKKHALMISKFHFMTNFCMCFKPPPSPPSPSFNPFNCFLCHTSKKKTATLYTCNVACLWDFYESVSIIMKNYKSWQQLLIKTVLKNCYKSTTATTTTTATSDEKKQAIKLFSFFFFLKTVGWLIAVPF